MPDTKKLFAFILVILLSTSAVSCQKPEIGSNPASNKTDAVDNSENSVVTSVGESTTTVFSGSSEKVDNGAENSSDASAAGLYKIERTTNKDGNASDNFINSLKGFELKILYPWKISYANNKCKKYAKKAKQEVEKLYGVKIREKGQYNKYSENLASEFAAKKSENHIYYAKSGLFTEYFKNGYFADLTPAMKESGVDLLEPWYDSETTGFLNIDGKQLGWISGEEDYTMPYFIIYNKKLLNKKGLNDPKNLARQGKWTWDTLREYSGKFYSDKNITGFAGKGINMLAAIAVQYGTQITKIEKGTQPITSFNDANFSKALNEYSDWTASGSFWCETFSKKGKDYAAKQFAKGKVAMFYGSYDDIKLLKDKSVVQNIGIAPFPSQEESSQYTNIAEPKYVAFVPSYHQSDASKILFIRNEYYRYNYRRYLKSLTSSLKTYLGDNDDAVLSTVNIKLCKDGNSIKYCRTKLFEDKNANVTTENIINQVETGALTADDAIKNNVNALTRAYANIWKRHRVTGNV